MESFTSFKAGHFDFINDRVCKFSGLTVILAPQTMIIPMSDEPLIICN